MLRFFKLVAGSNAPVPAVSVEEGEDIYLVAALQPGGNITMTNFHLITYSPLNPIPCYVMDVMDVMDFILNRICKHKQMNKFKKIHSMDT